MTLADVLVAVFVAVSGAAVVPHRWFGVAAAPAPASGDSSISAFETPLFATVSMAVSPPRAVAGWSSFVTHSRPERSRLAGVRGQSWSNGSSFRRKVSASTKMLRGARFAALIAGAASTPPAPCATEKTNQTCWGDSHTQCMWNTTTSTCSDCTDAGRVEEATRECHSKYVAGYGSHKIDCTDAKPDWVMLLGCPMVCFRSFSTSMRSKQPLH